MNSLTDRLRALADNLDRDPAQDSAGRAAARAHLHEAAAAAEHALTWDVDWFDLLHGAPQQITAATRARLQGIVPDRLRELARFLDDCEDGRRQPGISLDGTPLNLLALYDRLNAGAAAAEDELGWDIDFDHLYALAAC